MLLNKNRSGVFAMLLKRAGQRWLSGHQGSSTTTSAQLRTAYGLWSGKGGSSIPATLVSTPGDPWFDEMLTLILHL